MLTIHPEKIYISSANVDMRKSIDGLSAIVVDYLISAGLATVDVDFSSYYFGLIIAVWLIVNELISILENLAEIGTPIPKFLINIVHRLKNTVESNADSDTKE